ncbi:MAG: hypothetical protein ACOC4M_09585 [Promethearchaeia archaeon]
MNYIDRKGVLKGLKVFGLSFIIVSIVQFIGSIILMTIPMTIAGERTNLIELFGDTEIIGFSSFLLWIFIHLMIAYFLILGIMFLVLRKKEELEKIRLAKYLVVAGIFILIACFVQLKYILMLTRTEVSITGSPNFQDMIYDPDIVPFLADAIWISYTGVICGYLQFGLIITAGGLKWILEIEKQEEEKNQEKRSAAKSR